MPKRQVSKDAQRQSEAVECLRIAKAMSSVSFSGFGNKHLNAVTAEKAGTACTLTTAQKSDSK